jgi:hypothetical protein
VRISRIQLSDGLDERACTVLRRRRTWSANATARADDDEVIGIRDDLPQPFGRPHLALLAACRPPVSTLIPLLDRRLQPQLEQAENLSVGHPPGHALQQLGVGDGVEVLRHVGIDDVLLASVQPLLNLSQCFMGTALRPVGKDVILEVSLENRSQKKHDGGLCSAQHTLSYSE